VSEPLRVALVAEGPTDRIVIEAAIARMVSPCRIVLRQLQPEETLPFGRRGTGWGGVYHWCRDAVDRSGGSIRQDVLFENYDLLVLHLDADVANSWYSQAGIDDSAKDLPFFQPCPPASATTDRLRQVLLRWIDETSVPPRTVLCTPSKSAEAWVLAALFPADPAVRKGNLECWPDPEARLGQQPIRKRIRKSTRDYQNHATDLEKAWPALCGSLTEAARFRDEFQAAVLIHSVSARGSRES